MNINGEELAMPHVDLAAAAFSFLCRPSCFMLAMPPIEQTRGPIDLVRKRAKAKRVTYLTAGVVICAGESTGLEPGQYCLVSPWHAKRTRGLRSGFFSTDTEVWMYGITSPHVRSSLNAPPEKTIFGVVGAQEGIRLHPGYGDCGFPTFPVGTPGGSRILDDIHRYGGHTTLEGRLRVRFVSKNTMHGQLVLPERMADRPDIGLVEDCSPACRFVSPGMFVIYHRRGIDAMYPEDDRDIAYLPERAVYAACLPPLQ